MSLAEKLVTLRKQKGLTQMDLAERLNVSRQAISRWEVGAAVPSTDNLIVLSDVYGTTVDYLINDEADKVIESTPCQESEIGEKRTALVKKWKFFILMVIVFVILVVMSVAKGPTQNEQSATPIENMSIDGEDDLSTMTFPIE